MLYLLIMSLPFLLYHHITYSSVLSIFALIWSFGRCFVLILEKILFISWSFRFLATSMSSRVRFLQFVAWNIHTVGFFSLFYFLVIIVTFMFMLSILFLISMISLSLLFLMSSWSYHIAASTLSSMLASPLTLSLLDSYYLCHLSDVRPCVSSLAFLSSGPFTEVVLSLVSGMFPSFLPLGQPGCLYFWWYSCNRS